MNPSIYKRYKRLYNISTFCRVKETVSVERNFPVIISELRKEKGLSQKEAAAQLGISQALLSHYEKGIRECGQSFLVRVADFYGVTCDYLLGRTTERDDIKTVAQKLIDLNEDFKPSSKTFIRAAVLLREAISNSDKLADMKLDMVLATAVYRLLLTQAYTGNIPANWAGKAYVNGKVICTPVYLSLIDAASYNAVDLSVAKNRVPDAPVPEAIQTLVKATEDFIFDAFANDTPPTPIEFIK